MYILRGMNGLSKYDLTGLHYFFIVSIVGVMLILLLTSYILFDSITIYLGAFFILISNEIIESYMSLHRLFNSYGKMILFRLILLIKFILLLILLKSSLHYWISCLVIFLGISINAMLDLKMAIRAIFGHYGHYGNGNFQYKNYIDLYSLKEH